MPRFSAHGRLDTHIITDGDEKFTGLDLARDRALLAPGTLALSQNKRLNNGIGATRLGIGFPAEFNPGFTGYFVGSGVYSNPNGDEVLLVSQANANFVWCLESGKVPLQIPIVTGGVSGEPGTTTTERNVFVQASDKIYLMRADATGTNALLFWDGNPAGHFTPVVHTGTDTPLPGTVVGGAKQGETPWNGVPFQNRILFFNDNFPWLRNGLVPDRDTFIMSDVNDFSEYIPVEGAFRINSGESNVLMRVFPYFRQGVIVFFKRGLHMLENFTQPTPQTPSPGDQRLLNDFLGLVSPEAVAMSGADVLFLSEPGWGIYRISEAVQEVVAVNPLAVSDPIQPVIDDIDWMNAYPWVTARSLGQYIYWGVPLQGATDATHRGNNVMLVYNQFTRQWESIDTFADPDFRFHQLHVMMVNGSRQLIAVDQTRSSIHLMYAYDTLTDAIGPGGAPVPINDVMETRGYLCKDPRGFKRFQQTNIAMRTYDPKIELYSITDGYNEVKHLNSKPITKDRTRFYIHGKGRFNPATGDPNAPKRQDYSPGDIENKQLTLEVYQVRQNGRYASIRVDNSSGNCDVMSVTVDAIPAQEGIKTLA